MAHPKAVGVGSPSLHQAIQQQRLAAAVDPQGWHLRSAKGPGDGWLMEAKPA